MALEVKDAAASAAKFARNAQGATADYVSGAQARAGKFAANSVAGVDNWQQAVTAAGVKERLRRALQKAGAAKFSEGVATKGQVRYGPGVQAGLGDYQTNVAPFLQRLASLTLPPRRPRGDPGNYARSQAVGQALNAQRIQSMAGG